MKKKKDDALWRKAALAARRENMTIDDFVARAIRRDLAQPKILEAQLAANEDNLISIKDAAPILKLSLSSMRKRTRCKDDPLHAARSRFGKQKPIHYVRSKIEELRRAG